MLEAKAKNQGHRRMCSSKAKAFKILFQTIANQEKQKRSSRIFRKVSSVFLHNFKNKQIPSTVETDVNAHYAIWRFSNTNRRGEDLLAYSVSADLNFCDVGSNPTFRTKMREEILDFTLVNRCAWDRLVGWNVSNVLSFSYHLYIRFQVKSRIQNQAKMFRNVLRTCCNKYVHELQQKFN